ncbi:SPOR domain-containing protein [Thaumasiovibrio subtropicus]|uniref:SPOR domain-containing protein n=1 Tax=Thaumasiovibrio subtropicus TaxID=1891207 RepID=UPI00131B7C19|nr:SPOR domain-containing protein [Thaumasiovibrio subtropicus]
MLSSRCDIGDGVFKSEATRLEMENRQLWLQCGVVREENFVKTRDHIESIQPYPMRVSHYQEDQYRCLLGPFETSQQALEIKQKIKSESQFSDAFIRVVPLNAPSSTMVATVERVDANQVQLAEQSQRLKQEFLTSVGANSRYTLSMVYLGDNNSYYMEQYQKWSRVDFKSAQQICARHGMDLPDHAQFTDLEKTKSLERFPRVLPFWLSDGSAVVRGEKQPRLISPLSELNIACLTMR